MASEEAIARFLASGGEKPRRAPKEPKPPQRRAPIARARRPKQESVKQAILNAKWAGIREATIYWMNKLDPDGAHCMECGRKARTLDLDHIVPRSKGGHYSVSNAQLLCRDCHERKHRNRPEWSEGEAS